TANNRQVQRGPAIVVLPFNTVNAAAHVEHIPSLQMLNDDIANNLKAVLSTIVQRSAAGEILGQDSVALLRAQLVEQMRQQRHSGIRTLEMLRLLRLLDDRARGLQRRRSSRSNVV